MVGYKAFPELQEKLKAVSILSMPSIVKLNGFLWFLIGIARYFYYFVFNRDFDISTILFSDEVLF